MNARIGPPPAGEPAPPSLAGLRSLLLRDLDGDGFPDALAGPVWIALGQGPGDVDAAVAAAAELLAPLAERALVLPIDARSWRAPGPAFCIGPAVPPDLPATPAGELAVLPHGGRLLRLRDGLLATAPGGSLVGAVLGWLDGQADDPREPAAGPPERTPSAGAAPPTPPGLGSLLQGHGATTSPKVAFSGSATHPERFVGGFAPTGGAPEALAVALRLALAGTRTPSRVTAPWGDALVGSAIDPSLPDGAWAVRTVDADDGTRFEVVGHDAASLGDACRWFATGFPGLTDGARLDDVEDGLTRFVRGATRAGRVAAAASAARAARAAGATPVAAELPYPPAHAALSLGLPVRNSARDGTLRRWSTTVPWEGDRLLDAAAQLVAGVARGCDPATVEAFASEPLAVRTRLRERLVELLARVGLAAEVLPVRHAFRPALHWLVEEVAPTAPAAASTLRVRASRQPEAFGAAERWLRELYPVAELIEAMRPGLRVELELAETAAAPRYAAAFLDADGAVLADHALEPPVAAGPTPAGGRALTTTGGVRIVRRGRRVAEADVATDAEAFWRWFTEEALPGVTAALDPSGTPLLHEIAVIARLSEPDDRLPLDHETDSVLEALHEDVYFGVLEAVDRALGARASRTLSPGRVLPFFHHAAGAATRAHVLVRSWGTERVGVRTADGAWSAAAACGATVRVVEVRGRGARLDALTLPADGPPADAGEAERRLAGARHLPGVLPAAVATSLRGAAGASVDLGSSPPPPAPPPLPDRPLHPREALAHARAWASRHPSVRFATPRETRLGQPLAVVEVASPTHPAVSRARCAAWKPTLLVSARQHANEATSTPAAFAWLERWLADATLWTRANLVLHPLENPDGARLHASLRALAPEHLHHAARYTAFGADLQTNPVIRGETAAESLLRADAARRWNPVGHLNDHGYPAHAWIRSQTGFTPHGFADWSLPTGHLTILTAHDPDPAAAAGLQEALAGRVELALRADPGVHGHTRAQVRRSLRYRPAANTPFTFRSELPFWLQHRPARGHDPAAAATEPDPTAEPAQLAPLLTLITEVPDETVSGEAWDRCVRTHLAVNDAVARGLLAWLERDGDRSRSA